MPLDTAINLDNLEKVCQLERAERVD